MDLSITQSFGIPPHIITRWKEAFGPDLLPVQEKALIKYGVLDGRNLLVSAPTSSGKTFIGEMAAVKAALDHHRALYLVPLKAIAHEKYEEFQARYRDAGFKIVLSTRDFNKDDDALWREQFDIAILVYEKLQSLLVSSPHFLQSVRLVVVDELQMLGDDTRGANLELLLTKILDAQNPPQIVGLSAVLGRAGDLATWFRAELLEATERPVELRKGILFQGRFHYKEHNSGQSGEEPLSVVAGENEWETILLTAAECAARNEQTLVFLADKRSTLSMAEELAKRVQLPPAVKALEELETYEPSSAREYLADLLRQGVAFHNADLGWEYRSLVEKAFREGEITLLVSTTTLAMGMNLPCRNVILAQRKWVHDSKTGRWHQKDLSRTEFENMAGRAARTGIDAPYGRAMIVANRLAEVQSLRQALIERPFEDLAPALGRLGLEEQALNLIASGLAETPEEVGRILLRSFTGLVRWQRQHSTPEFQEMVRHAIQVCLDAGLVFTENGGRLRSTLSGNVVAAKGVRVSTGKVFREYVCGMADFVPHTLEFLQLLGHTPDGMDAYIGLSTPEFRDGPYPGALLREVQALRLENRPPFGYLRHQRDLLYEQVQNAKKTLLLWRWIQEVPGRRLEGDFQIWEGSIRRIAEEYAWLMDTLAMMMIAKRLPEPFLEAVHALRVRLLTGIKEEASGLGEVRVRGLGRVSTRKLMDAGLGTLEMVADQPVEKLKEILNNGPLATRLHDALKLYRVAEEALPDELPVLPETNGDHPVSTLRIDRERRELVYQGVPVILSPKSLAFFLLLAKTPHSYIPTARILQEVWERNKLDRDYHMVYDQVKQFKRRAEAAFRSHAKDPGPVLHLVLSRQGAGFMLNVPPSQVQVV